MELDFIENFNGVSELIFVIITIILGSLIIAKYPKNKNRIYVLVGFVWIGVAQPWFAGTISYLYTLITSNLIPVFAYLLIAFVFMPLTIFLWCFAFTELIYKDKQKLILSLVAVWGIIFEVIFLYFLFTDPSTLATLYSPLVIEYKLFLQMNLLIIISIALSTGILFGFKTKQLDHPEQKLRGNFLMFAFIFFTIGAILDTIFIEDVLFIIIKRIILISASIEFYCSFVLPNWIKNLFLKQN